MLSRLLLGCFDELWVSTLTGLDRCQASRLFDEAIEEGKASAGGLESGVLGLAFLAEGLDVFWVETEVMNGESDSLFTDKLDGQTW